MPFIIEVVDLETGRTTYVTRGEWSDFSLDDRVSSAKHFDTLDDVNQALQSPDFTKCSEFSGGSKAPPSILWTGLKISYAKPRGRGEIRVYELIYKTVSQHRVEAELIRGKED